MSEPIQITPGTIVYHLHGGEAEYVGLLPNGHHIVRPGYAQYDPNPDVGEYTRYAGVAEWHEVFLKPPVEKLHAEVVALQDRVKTLTGEVAKARMVLIESEQEIAGRKERIARHEQLAQLDDYLAGKITHFVVQKHTYGRRLSGIIIETFKDAMESKERWNCGRMKLLTLYGDPKEGLAWGINTYHTDYDRDCDVIPCTSLEQAREVARKLYEEELALWRAEQAAPSVGKPAKTPWCASTLVGHAMRLDFPVPLDAVEAVAATKRDAMEGAVESARKALLKAEADLQALRSGQPFSDESVACAPLPA